jgi:hypothetical protein
MYVIYKYNMHKKIKSFAQLSRLRLKLRHLLAEFRQLSKVFLERGPLVKGNVYELARRCGQPRCRCARGSLHRSMVLSYSHQGKTRLFTIPPGKLDSLRQKSEAYLHLRRQRALIVNQFQEILRVMDALESGRRQSPETVE